MRVSDTLPQPIWEGGTGTGRNPNGESFLPELLDEFQFIWLKICIGEIGKSIEIPLI